MKPKLLAFFYICLLVLTTGQTLYAQTYSTNERNNEPTTRILFVFDASRSMYGEWQNEVKIDIARRLLSNMLDSLRGQKNLQMALRVYGHQHNFPPQYCDDTRLEVPFSFDNVDRMKYKLKTIVPKGTTPIARSLQQSANDFTPCDNCRNIIILITDGIEECGGDPCEVSLALQKKGIALKPFIIGIGKNFQDAFDCVGTYFDAQNEEEFRSALNIAISKALNPTTAQVNLLDIKGNPTETNVNMTFYDRVSGEEKYNFIHTINAKGNPDTLELDPMIAYKIDIHTIPTLTIDSFGLTAGKHNTIGVDAPQGYLDIAFDKTMSKNNNVNCIIREEGSMRTLHVQNLGEKEKYLIGKYDLEVLTLPRMIIEDVGITQSHTTRVKIPAPGIAIIKMNTLGYGSLYEIKNDGSLNWIYNLSTEKTRESLYLLPGFYKVVFRPKSANRAKLSREATFQIESGKAKSIEIYK